MTEEFDNKFNKKFKEILLNTFKEAIDFLDNHGLRWWAAYGTTLGAVRHKGLIPWDDDIDIYMPREDYNKLLALRSEMAGTNIDVNSYNDDGYFYSFGKFVNKNTTLWELKEYSFVGGVYIDIFAIELTDDAKDAIVRNHKLFSHKLRRMQLAYNKLSFKAIAYGLFRHGLSYMQDVCFSKLHKSQVVADFKNYDNSLNKEYGDKYVRYAGSGYRIFDKSWFDSYVELPFEWFSVKVPIGYKRLLELNYGDYMTPPPIDKRVSEHIRVYLNLNERLSMDEVKIRLKHGEKLVY